MPSLLADQARELFRTAHGGDATVAAVAPGRIEFIGNHTDYNGGPVLGAAIDRGVAVALRLRDDDRKLFCSTSATEIVTETSPDPGPRRGPGSWINYPLGVWKALPAFGFKAPRGFEIAVTSDLPSGAGLSSSAALELATALALLSASGQAADNATLAAIGRKAENEFVGVPCGILDQGTSAFGRAGHLVHIDCRGPHFRTVPLPAGARLWIFNTHSKHSLVDSLYATRNRECHDAARQLGVERLADLTPEQLNELAGRLDPTLLRRARHIVGECSRVGRVMDACTRGDLPEVGKILEESHASSRENFENSTPELDLLADALNAHPRVHGARLTGGGFGGATMALASPGFNDADARAIADQYVARYNHVPAILQCAAADGAHVAR
jgi:galactokinase